MTAPQVKARREEIGLSQQDLAALAGISRQALGAIESGRAGPSVGVALRIASSLGATVEEIFGEQDGGWAVRARTTDDGETGRRVVAYLRGKWVCHTLGEREHDLAADGVVKRGAREVRLFRPPDVARANVIVMGCAPFLGVLCDRLNAERGPGRFIWLPRPSHAGVDALAEGATHLAGMHLTDGDGRDRNAVYLAQRSLGASITLITLAHWEVGLVVARNNPRSIRRAADVAKRGVRLVNRERQASPRRLLERRMRAEGTTPPPEEITVRGHREVAQAVASGAADVGPSVRDVAISFGLDFVPFCEERFDLAVPTDLLSNPEMRRMLDVLVSARSRTELSALGYDTRETGRHQEVA